MADMEKEHKSSTVSNDSSADTIRTLQSQLEQMENDRVTLTRQFSQKDQVRTFTI